MTAEQPPFEQRWLDELADGCRGLRGHHPRFEDLYLERRLELRVAAGAELASVQIDGGASRWRFADRWAMHAAAGISSSVVAGLVSRYADRLDPPPVPATPPAALAPPPGWVDWARGLADRPALRGAVIRCFVRRAVVVRRDGWRAILAPALVRIEPAGGSPALLAVWGQPLLGDWLRRFSEPPPGRTWTPPAGLRGPVVLTDGTAGVLLHELVGHLVEGDLIADGRSPLAGLGGAALTDAAIDLVDDPCRRDLPGAFDCDDEGVPARPLTLLRAGRLCGLLCDRDTAGTCGTEPGRGRRADWRQPPRPRLSNLIVPAGRHPARELEAGVERGLVVTRFSGATVDPGSGRAVLRVERGFELQHGRRRRPLSAFELTGSVTEILASIDPRFGDDPTPDWRLGWCVKDGTPLPTGSEAPTLVVGRLEVL